MADFTSAFHAVPPVTRIVLLATGLVTIPALLGLLSPYHVALIWPRVARLQIWRIVTPFFYGGSGFPLLYDVFLIFRNSSSLETVTHLGDTAGYAWMHIVIAVFIHAFNIPFAFPFLFRPLLHAQNYIWCRANPTMKISIFGLITIPTSRKYLSRTRIYPFALIGLDLLTGGPGKALGGTTGLLAGHLWWFISVYLPLHAPARHRRSNPLDTPPYFRSLFRSSARPGFTSRSRIASTSTSTAAGTGSRSSTDVTATLRHRWGNGNRLGGEAL